MPKLPSDASHAAGEKEHGKVVVLPSPVVAVSVPKAAEVIADHFRKDIAAGRLREGDSLPQEGELVAHFGVSRPTLRSAFRILESESLLTIAKGAHGGPRIRYPTIDVTTRSVALLLRLRGTRMGDLFQVRATIVPAAAGLLAERRPPEGLAALESALVAEEAALSDAIRFEEAALSFYSTITEHCGNDILSVFGGVLQELLGKVGEFAARQEPGRTLEAAPAAAGKHRELVSLMKHGSVAETQVVCKRYLDEMQASWADISPLRFDAFERRTIRPR
jgi:DNA-binding FadR family transcriptional regulator